MNAAIPCPIPSPSSTDAAEGVLLLIPAGGRGVRMGGGVPKQFRDWGGVPLLRATIQAFLGPGMPPIAGIALAVPPDYLEEVRSWVLGVPTWVVVGGGTRQESVRQALEAAQVSGNMPVLIHDAVRPFPPARPIWQAIAALEAWDGAVLAEASTDTLKRVDPEGRVLATVPREEIYRAQTPQVARLQAWRRAFGWAVESGFEGTDDVSLLEAMGMRVRIIPSPSSNLKLTTPEDWVRAPQR
ncbi:MAG: ispF [Holophagaceae bacterium]|nr:ispF [Holophagaceae bacterium]